MLRRKICDAVAKALLVRLCLDGIKEDHWKQGAPRLQPGLRYGLGAVSRDVQMLTIELLHRVVVDG